MDTSFQQHELTAAELQKNFDSQDKIIAALIEANAKFAENRLLQREAIALQSEGIVILISDHHRTHGLAVDALLQAYVSFKEIKSKLERGTGFYRDMLGQLDDLSATIDELNNFEGPFPPVKSVRRLIFPI